MSDPNKQHHDKAGLHDDDVEAHGQGLIDDDSDVEGHRLSKIEGDDDVEGHRNRPDRNRPDFQSDPERNRPGLLEEDDVEGHRLIGTNVQPPRDADLGNAEH